MIFLKDEQAQGSAELVLLFGGMIVIVVIAAIWYQNYLSGLGSEITNTELEDVTNDIKSLENKFKVE